MSDRGPGLGVKLVVTLVLSLILIDSLAYAVARRSFERSEVDALHASSDALLRAMALRIDERIDEWEEDVVVHLHEAIGGDVDAALTDLRDHGLDGALFQPSRGGASRTSLGTHSDDDVATLARILASAIDGASIDAGHVIVAASAEGGRIVAWATLDRFEDILTAPEPIAVLAVDDARLQQTPEGGGIERAAVSRVPLVLEMQVDHAGAVAAAGRYAQRFLLASTIALAATGFLAIYVVGRSLAPLAAITQAAKRIGAPGEPPLRLGIDTGDEVQVLAETLEASSAALAQARERERDQAERLRRAEVDYERLAAAVEIERREADHRRVLEALTDCVLVVDGAGQVLLANAAARTQGFTVGRSLAETLETDDARQLLAHVARATLASAGPMRVRTDGGALLDVRMRSIAYDDDEAVLLVATDVTERVRLATEAEDRRAALARSERLSSLGTLVAGVAHEINNPLTYINGNIELALMDLEGDAKYAYAAEGLQRALSGTQRIGHITQALRAVARQDPSQTKEDVDLGAVARNVGALLAVGLPDQVDLEVVASAEPVRVRGSSTELHQVVLNLAKNAIEAVAAVAPAGGHVRIRCVTLDGEAYLAVEDDGPGLPPGVADKLFTPFYTTKPGGTGLGLSIAQGIVRDHGGRIEVSSTPGKGATFRFRLPLTSPRQPAPAPPAPAASAKAP